MEYLVLENHRNITSWGGCPDYCLAFGCPGYCMRLGGGDGCTRLYTCLMVDGAYSEPPSQV